MRNSRIVTFMAILILFSCSEFLSAVLIAYSGETGGQSLGKINIRFTLLDLKECFWSADFSLYLDASRCEHGGKMVWQHTSVQALFKESQRR